MCKYRLVYYHARLFQLNYLTDTVDSFHNTIYNTNLLILLNVKEVPGIALLFIVLSQSSGSSNLFWRFLLVLILCSFSSQSSGSYDFYTFSSWHHYSVTLSTFPYNAVTTCKWIKQEINSIWLWNIKTSRPAAGPASRRPCQSGPRSGGQVGELHHHARLLPPGHRGRPLQVLLAPVGS